MLTEEWPLERDPDWSPRWVPSTGSRPLVAYLDQWCYDHLGRDRAGCPKIPEEAGSYEFLRALALDGSVVFPLSQAHYRENWNRQNIDARWDTAVVMAELSGFHTLSTLNLEAWDALQGVATFTQSAVRIDAPDVAGWGFRHCLTGRGGSAYIMDRRTGKPAQWDSLPDDLQRSIAELETSVAYRFELAMLALRDQRLESRGMLPFAPIPDAHGDRFINQEANIRKSLDNYGRSPKTIRNTIEFLSYRDSWTYLVSALRTLGLPPNLIDDTLVQSLTSDGRSPAMHDLIEAMPIQGVFTELRVRAHLKEPWKGKSSDLLDFLTMATALPFVNYFVADKKTYHLAKDARINERHDCHIIRSLRDLCELLHQKY
jgi:hypothetical protein